MNTQTPKQIELTRTNSDINGNPRYIAHFLNFINKMDKDTAEYLAACSGSHMNSTLIQYDIALNKARKIGGTKFRGKSYGGGIVFQSYNNDELSVRIADLKKYPYLLPNMTDKQIKGLKRAIREHFNYSEVKTHTGEVVNFFKPSFDELDKFFGLAYTSGSSYAGLWVCNVDAENKFIPGFKYVGFAAGTDGEYYAILWDANENEKIIRL